LALFIAQRHLLLRAAAYASYGDYLPTTGEAADWVAQPYVTPTERLSGFISSSEDAISYPIGLSTWSLIGMRAVGLPHADTSDVSSRGHDAGSSLHASTYLLRSSGNLVMAP